MYTYVYLFKLFSSRRTCMTSVLYFQVFEVSMNNTNLKKRNLDTVFRLGFQESVFIGVYSPLLTGQNTLQAEPTVAQLPQTFS